MKKVLGIVLSVVVLLTLLLPVLDSSLVFATDLPKPEKVVVDKQPKDENTRNTLIAQGIDPEYVELVKDYGLKSEGKSPYSKEYKDIISGKHILEIQQLPMVNANGSFLDTTWTTKDNKNFAAGINQFIASVATNKVTVIVLNDQPDGKTKKDMALSFQPQLFLDEKEIKPSVNTPVLLAVDPVNSNYTNNTLEWDYGICKRRLRIIEGNILGSWVFSSNPNGIVRIKYNQTGDYRLKLGQSKVGEDEEVIEPSGFDRLAKLSGYPVTVSDSGTFYPDAHAESTSVDGMVQGAQLNATWAQIIARAGDYAYPSDNDEGYIGWREGNQAGKFHYLYRFIALFDTSPLPDSGVVSAAVLSYYGYSKSTDSGVDTYHVVSSNPATDTNLVPADYSTLGAVVLSNSITNAGFSVIGYNDFTLIDVDADGFGYIKKTAVDGITKLGIRESHDASGADPGSSGGSQFSTIVGYASEQGAGYKPKLVVTYTIPTPEITNTPDTQAWNTVALSTTSTTAINYFTITNTGDGAVDITIQGTDFTGGDDTWDLSDDASIGDNIYGLKAGLDDDDDTFDITVQEASPVTLVSNLLEAATQGWGLKIYMPSAVTGYDRQQMTATVTLVCSAH